MSEHTEEDLRREIAAAATRINPVTLDEIKEREAVTVPADVAAAPEDDLRHENRSDYVVELLQVNKHRSERTKPMANRLWLLGATAAAVLIAIIAIGVALDGGNDPAEENPAPTTNTTVTEVTEPEETTSSTATATTEAAIELLAVDDEIDVGGSPFVGVEANGSAWISNQGAGTVIRIQSETGEVTVIEVGRRPAEPAADDQWLWVALGGDNAVARIDTTTNDVLIIPVGENPTTPAVDENSVWVPNGVSNTVSQIDKVSATVVATIETGLRPLAPVIAGGSVWVPNEASGTVTRIDQTTGEVVDTITTTGAHWAVAAGNTVFIGRSRAETLVPIDLTTGEPGTQIGDVGTLVTRATVVGDDLWIAKMRGADDPTARSEDAPVIWVDGVTGEIKAEILVGASPSTPTSDGTSIWVANNISDTVSRIDMETLEVIETYAVGDAPGPPIFAGGSIWVPNQKSGTISRIDIN